MEGTNNPYDPYNITHSYITLVIGRCVVLCVMHARSQYGSHSVDVFEATDGPFPPGW
jgi:hypothetical protein